MIKVMLWLIMLAAGWPVAPLHCPQVQHFLAYLSATVQGVTSLSATDPPITLAAQPAGLDR
jgi:hypothetical protein